MTLSGNELPKTLREVLTVMPDRVLFPARAGIKRFAELKQKREINLPDNQPLADFIINLLLTDRVKY